MAKLRRTVATYERASGTELSRLAVWIPLEMHQAFRLLSVKERRAIQMIVIDALRDYLRSTA